MKLSRITLSLLLMLALAVGAGGCATHPRTETRPERRPAASSADEDSGLPPYRMKLRTQRGERVTDI